ncbi:MAG: adenylate/guanylate cyclase domain-containing protein [Ilumatobacteraceae bacterium]
MPETKFAQSSGISIAYQVVGDGPIDIVFVPGFMSHVELNWEYSFYSSVLEDLASYGRLIVLDKRGTGLSDRSMGLGTFEERMDDVRSVMDAAGSERAALVGVSEGGAMCTLMAASHPDRVTSLVLIGSACPGLFNLGEAERAGFLKFVHEGWYSGRVLDFFIQNAPDPVAALPRLARFERYCCEPAMAREIMVRNVESDIRHALPSVTVPTLVLHNRKDPVVPLSHGEYYAQNIPGAEHVFFDADFHGSWRSSDYDDTFTATRHFLTGKISRPVTTDRILSTVLFTDIADSTTRAAEMGDARWRDLLDRHDAAASEEVAGHNGVLIKSTGDGILARFDGPSRAVLCADALGRRAGGLGLAIRAGVHTGEIELRGADVGGIGVHIASRVAGLASAGEILVSRTVKDLSAGSSVSFADRGEHELKGVPESWQLYAASIN